MKRFLDCTASDFNKMNKKELLEAISASEGRLLVCETIGTLQPMLGDVTNAEFAAANSAFVTSPSIGCSVPIVSHTKRRPSLADIASSNSFLFILLKSDAVQSKNRFNALVSLVSFFIVPFHILSSYLILLIPLPNLFFHRRQHCTLLPVLLSVHLSAQFPAPSS